nr:talin-2 isoform X2 [Onthophagus taurus]
MALSLKINIVDSNVTKTIVFDSSSTVYDACKIIREKCTEANLGQPKDYGLFLTDSENKSGVWLEPGRQLAYYILRTGDLLEYRKKLRTLRVKMLDGSVKTMLVDDSQIVANLMVVICTKIGITNHDEYSLVLDEPDNQENLENRNYGTLTLKRKKEEKGERDAKMELLRKKLKTDDELNWVDPTKTLREQGIDEHETVLLRRKFFFSDQNIDSRDPVQLNLLYVQARDAILDGTHPITLDKACEFAGIQCQIQFGDHVETKHKSGFLDLKEFLPQSYVKIKAVDKKIFGEHKKHSGMNELEAKVLYTKNARSLNTYGVTFFLVKEKMKGKNKLVPRLLGVNKDSVLRLDENTKEILKTWPLTSVKRWGASPNTFTLDFGDYSDQYYSVQTTEGEQIQQIIAGYIDIILKKQQAKDHFGIGGDSGSAMEEVIVLPNRGAVIERLSVDKGKKQITNSIAKPGIIREVEVSNEQHPKVTPILTEPQRALISTIMTTQKKLEETQIDLEAKAQIPELGSDPHAKKWKQVTLDTRKQNVGSQIAAMNAATAQVVTLTSGPAEEVDHTAVGAAITTIGSNLPEMTKDVKMIASLMDDSNMGEKLIDATKKLVNAFSDLLKTVEPEAKEPRQKLLNAASRVGEASSQVLATIGEDTTENKELQDMLLSLAKVVANTTAALVLKAKDIASTCDDQQTQNHIIGAATQCALATSQLVACAKVVAPTLQSPACQEQLTMAVREVTKAVENLVALCNDSCSNEDLMSQLREAAANVTKTLNDMLKHIELVAPKKATESIQEKSVETIYSATDKIISVTGDAGEMVRHARVLGQATAQLITSIKGEAEKQQDTNIQRKLLAAAKTLADATSKLVEAARQCANSPQDLASQDNLRKTAEDLRDVTILAVTTPALRAKLVDRVHVCARRAVASATQCVPAAQASHPYNNNMATREALKADTTEMVSTIPPLVDAIRSQTSNPEDTNNQVGLMYVAEVFLHPATHFVQSSRAVLPTVVDESVSHKLSETTQTLNTELNELRSAISRAKPACQGLGFDAATQLIEDLREELLEFEKACQSHNLRPLPGDTVELAAQQLGISSKAVNQSIARFISATSHGNEIYMAQAARDTAESLKNFTGAIRAVAATTEDVDSQFDILEAGKDVFIYSAKIIKEAQRCLQKPNVGLDPEVTATAKNITEALDKTVSCLPGQRDVDVAITCIKEWSNIIDRNQFPTTNKSYGELQQELNTAAANLNEASADVVTSVKSPAQLASSAKDFGSAFHELLQVSMEMAGQSKDGKVQKDVVYSLKNVSTASSGLLRTAKTVSADPNLPNGKNQLQSAARAVTESINSLVEVCTSSAPGQAECDNAIRNIQAMKPLLDNPTEPINEFTYYECWEAVKDRSKCLGEGMTGITNSAKQSDHEKFAEYIRIINDSICGFVEATAQAAYFVGVSDPTSTAGRPGIIDQALVARAAQAIRVGCQQLSSPTSAQDQIVSAATIIARHTSALCNACRAASGKTSNPVAKRQFVQSAKNVANSTGHLVQEIKALDVNFSDENRQRCAEATEPLLEAVDNLCVYANSSEFITIPAKISHQGRQAQEPILDAGRKIIDSSCAVIQAAKSLVVLPKDPPTWHQFASNSKNVSDAIKKLISSILDKAPGKAECDEAALRLQELLRALDSASMEVIHQTLTKRGQSLQACSQQVGRAAAELKDTIEPLKQAAKFESQNIGHCVNQLAHYFEPVIQGSIAAASNLNKSKQQEVILNQAKSVTESALQFIYASKDCGGNSKATQLHPDVDECASSTKEALQELVNTIEDISTQSGFVSSVVDNLTRAMTRLTDHRASFIMTDGDSYVDYQTRMVECAKDIAKIASEMCTKATLEPQRLAPLSADLSHKYTQLANDSLGAAATSTNGDISIRLKEAVQDLGGACVDVVHAGDQCQMRKDEGSIRAIGDASRNVSEKVSRVLATLQSGSRGTQACINAASTVSGIIGDLDTTIMFATAGNLNPETEDQSFADHRENILKTAKALVEDTKTLVAGAAASQEKLAAAAQNAVSTIVQLAEVVKFGAASLGSDNPDSQVMLINAVKDVASALGDLIHATKAASGKPINDPAMAHLKDSAKVMVTNVTSLLKTVKAVEDEHTRGTRALESTVEAIGQEMKALSAGELAKTGMTPEDIIRCTKAITKATSKSVAAGISNKQDDIIAAANLSRRAVSDMLVAVKSCAFNIAETKELRERALNAGYDCAQQFRELLMSILNGNTADAKQVLPQISRKIAQSVTELVTLAELLKGSDWVDPNDPTVIAENELLGAAASIDAAAKKLASLCPRKSIKTSNLEENMNFDEMILEAAKSITAATSALVKAASAAQRELIEAGKVSSQPLLNSDDDQWSEGLISAARMVAAATHTLVESANALVQGLAGEEKLISSAKQVATSTAHLLVACKVKAEGDTEATRRLQQAGNAVIKSTDNLVRAAQQAITVDEDKFIILHKRAVGRMADEINAKVEILRRERELEEARAKLKAIHQFKYRAGETSGEETDGYLSSGYDGATSRTDYYQQEHQYKPHQYNTYNEKFTHLESPEKVNMIDQEKKIKSSILHETNALDSAVYGGGNNYNQPSTSPYNTYGYPKAPTSYSPDNRYNQSVSNTQTYDAHSYGSGIYGTTQNYSQNYPQNYGSIGQYAVPTKSPYSSTIPPTMPSIQSSIPKFDTPLKIDEYRTITSGGIGSSTHPGYVTSEVSSNTFKTPDGYQTNTYRYETYQSNSEPYSYSMSEKYYTSSPPSKLEHSPIDQKSFQDHFKNGSDMKNFSSNFSTQMESFSDVPSFKDGGETLEQKMLKKSMTQHVTEKKTVSMTRSTKQETSTKNFKFE